MIYWVCAEVNRLEGCQYSSSFLSHLPSPLVSVSPSLLVFSCPPHQPPVRRYCPPSEFQSWTARLRVEYKTVRNRGQAQNASQEAERKSSMRLLAALMTAL